MELRFVLRGVVAFCLEVCVFHGLVAGTTTTGFPSLDTIRNPGMDTRTRRNRDQWLFPSIVFGCTGTITKWTFRARDSLIFNNGLPKLQVWRRQEFTVNPDDYMLVASSGSEAELQGEGPVYEYVLQPPIEVEEGDIFGVFLADQGTERIAVEYLDLGEGNTPDSYWFNQPASFIENLSAGTLEQRFLPLVTAEISLGAGTTTPVVLPSPTPSPPNVGPDESSSAPPSPSNIELFSATPAPSIPTMPGEDSGTEDQPSLIPIVVPVAVLVGASLAVVLILLILIVFTRHKKQKSFAVSEQQQTAVPKHEEQFEMTKNDAYTAVIATARNEAYMTNTDSIPAAWNAAYGVTKLEGENTLNRDNTTDGTYVVNQPVYDEPQGQHVQTIQGGTDDYDYV